LSPTHRNQQRGLRALLLFAQSRSRCSIPQPGGFESLVARGVLATGGDLSALTAVSQDSHHPLLVAFDPLDPLDTEILELQPVLEIGAAGRPCLGAGRGLRSLSQSLWVSFCVYRA